MHESTHPAFAEPAARVEEIPELDRGPGHGPDSEPDSGPEPAGESGRTRSLKRLRSPFSAELGTILAIVAAAAYVYLLRRPSGLQAPVMFAEDGTVFFKDAIERGLGALFAPYNGQIFIPQRLVATLAAYLPVAIQPAAYAVFAAVVAVGSCSIILSGRWRFAVPLRARAVGLFALVSAPGVGETYMALSYVHWWLGIGLLMVGLLHDPESRKGRIGEVLFTAVTALSGFAALYGIPTLSVRAYREKSSHSLILLAIAFAGVFAQMVFLLLSSRHGDISQLLHPLSALLILAKHVPATVALADTNLASLWFLKWPDPVILPVVVAMTAAIGVVWARGPRLEVAALVVTLLGGWFLAMWSMTTPGLSLDMLFWPNAASRYFLAPIAILYLSLLLAPAAGRVWRAAVGLSCALMAVGILSGYALPATVPVDWGPFAQCIEQKAGPCTVDIPPGWSLEVNPGGG